MSDHDGFLRAIVANPDDDGPRLIYADWLDEHGDPRGEFIRLQCAQAKTKEGSREWCSLRARADKLWKVHRDDWCAPLPVHNDLHFWTEGWRRGFASSLLCFKLTTLRRQRQLLTEFAPIDSLYILRTDLADLPKVLALKEMTRLRALHFEGEAGGQANNFTLSGDETAAVVAGSPRLAGLRSFSMGNMEVGPAGLRALAESPHLKKLNVLSLHHNRIGNQGAALLANADFAPGLTSLTLWDNRITAPGAAKLATLTGLKHLELGANNIKSNGLQSLAESPQLAGLTDLGLRDCQIGDEGVRALAGSPHLANLRSLNLGNNRLGNAGARALAASTYLQKIQTLDLDDGAFSKSAVKALCRRFGKAVIVDYQGVDGHSL